MTDCWVFLQAQAIESVAREVVDLAKCENGEVESGQVMMQEELTSHQEEREIVEEPAKNAGANFVVEALESDVVVITEATLPSDDSKCLDGKEQSNEGSRTPPNDRVSYNSVSTYYW